MFTNNRNKVMEIQEHLGEKYPKLVWSGYQRFVLFWFDAAVTL